MKRIALAVVAAGAVACLLAGPAAASFGHDADLARKGLKHAVKAGRLLPEDAAGYRAVVSSAQRTYRSLSGSRAENLAAVMHDVALQRAIYKPPRALTLFSMLEVNASYLSRHDLPPAGRDVLDEDGVVYRSFPGQGLQFHPLGNFARLNFLLARPAHAEAADTLAEALVARGVPIRGRLVWEYYFPFGGGSPPWTSGMVQAVAAKALAAAGDYDEAQAALAALPSLIETVDGTPWVKLYSFSDAAVLNAQLQAIVSLDYYAAESSDESASALAGKLLASAKALLPRFDTGAWDLYQLGGPEAPLEYHLFVISLLRKLARQTGDPFWTTTADRFDWYTTQPPKVVLRGPRGAVNKLAKITIRVSKVSTIRLRVGRGVYFFTLSRGTHIFTWNAQSRRAGRYVLRLRATDVAGNVTTVSATRIVVKHPRLHLRG